MPELSPNTPLSSVNAAMIRRIIESQRAEGPFLEFKRMDGDPQERVRDAVASFANSEGGFVICGIADVTDSQIKNPASLHERIMGIPHGIKEFGQWTDSVLNKGLLVPNAKFRSKVIKFSSLNKEVGVIRVEPSNFGPIASRKKSDTPLIFYKRGEQSKVLMPYTDLMKSFDGSLNNNLITCYKILFGLALGLKSYERGIESLGDKVQIVFRGSSIFEKIIDKILPLVAAEQKLSMEVLNLFGALHTIEDNFLLANSIVMKNGRLENLSEVKAFLSTQISQAENAIMALEVFLIKEHPMLQDLFSNDVLDINKNA